MFFFRGYFCVRAFKRLLGAFLATATTALIGCATRKSAVASNSAETLPKWFEPTFKECVQELKSDDLFGGINRPKVTVEQLDRVVTYWLENGLAQRSVRDELRTPFLTVVDAGNVTDSNEMKASNRDTNDQFGSQVFRVAPWRNPIGSVAVWGPVDSRLRQRADLDLACLDDSSDPMGDPRTIALLAPESSRFLGYVYDDNREMLSIPSVGVLNKRLDAFEQIMKTKGREVTSFRYFREENKISTAEYLDSVSRGMVPKSEKGALWIHDTSYHSAFHLWPLELQLETISVLVVARELLKGVALQNESTESNHAAIKALFQRNVELRGSDPQSVIQEMASNVARAFDVYNGNVGVNLLELKFVNAEDQHWNDRAHIAAALSMPQNL